MKVAYVFPGQGSQKVGMGLDLYDSFPSARTVFEQADEVLGFPLSRLCFEGPEAELRQTINAQPALLATSFACFEAIHELNSNMQSAVDGMAEILATIPFRDPMVPIIANTTAEPMTGASELKAELLRQLCNGVQWQRSIEHMLGEGVTTFIEIGPGEVLSGLIKRINRDVETTNIGDAATVSSIAGEDGS